MLRVSRNKGARPLFLQDLVFIRVALRVGCAAGKARKVALTACMGKLLIILNSMIKHQQAWHSDVQNP